MRTALVMMITAGMLIPTVADAQSSPGPNGGVGTVGIGQPIVIDLPGQATLTFSPDGAYKVVVPGVHEGGIGSGSVSGGSTKPSPDPSQAFQPVDLEALDLAIRTSNASRCLTQMGFLCAPAPPSLAGRLNERSTRVDANWLVERMERELEGDTPLPAIQIQANPNPGVTGIPTWFWVDPASYGGQAFSSSSTTPVPWTLFWDEIVHHHEVSAAPCPDDPAQQCTTTRDWDETVTHHEEHQDFITVSVQFSPAQFTWDFGDDVGGGRPDSHPSFANLFGMGLPYTGPRTRSTVEHNYSESSLKVFDQGGFPIELSMTWSAAGTWHFTSDLGDNRTGTRTLNQRFSQYSIRYQVRESQPVSVASSR